MRPLRILLTVPYYENRVFEELEDKIAAAVEEYAVDIVVLPEGYLHEVPFDSHIDEVKKYSEFFNIAVLMGMSTIEGYEIASFYNLYPLSGDTKEHLYIKHSYADKLAYEYENYDKEKRRMFRPIRIKGHEIGVCICYDMFFPLIPTRYVSKGRNADIIIDISYGKVKKSKWENIVAGRSLESRVSFLCTMGYDPTYGSDKSRSVSIAFHDGKRMKQITGKLKGEELITNYDGAEAPGFAIVEFPVDEGSLAQRRIVDKYYEFTGKGVTRIDEISVSLGKLTGADISLIDWGTKVAVKWTKTPDKVEKGRWNEVPYKEGKSLRFIILDISEISNPLVLMENLPPDKDAYHLVFYCGRDNGGYSNEDLYTLAKLRAIENRVAVICYTPSIKEVIRANYEKMTSRFPEIDGTFEFKAIAVGGPLSVFTKANNLSGYVKESLDLINV